uniref:Uncharacterized protein n=1 Tax=Solanum lycopersicum TaxID=4081 RepID=A0A494G8E2_SOLLC
MPSSSLDSTHGRTTSGMACHHSTWMPNKVERFRAWHAIIAFGQHTRSNDVGCDMPSSPLVAHTIKRRRAWHAIIAFGQHIRSNDVEHGMPSSRLGSTNDRTTSGVARNDISSLGQHTRSADVGRGMPSLPLGSTHGRTTSGLA